MNAADLAQGEPSNVLPLLTLGFVLGMRHATDADHVVAVSAIASRARRWRAAAPIGALWGAGHLLTILGVGTAIVVFGVVIPPRVALALELAVGCMLVVLGALNLARLAAPKAGVGGTHVTGAAHAAAGTGETSLLRPLVVGVVHGLAGSAAVALLVLGTIHRAGWAVVYLTVFGLGTIAGMLLITSVIAVPVAAAAGRFERLHRVLGFMTGVASVALGAVIIYQIGFVDGLLHWRASY